MDTSPCIKEVVRSASVAFAPDAPFLAAGTMAGAVDMSFSSSANLEIFQLDFQSDDRKLPLVGAVSSPEPFNRLSWGKSPSSGSEEFSLGLVAGGLVDGNIGIWNPRLLISSEESESSIVQTLSRHKGPVRGLEFSSLSPNHLASGAEEGDICIWDISKPTEPTHFPPLKGSGSATQGEISFLSWNKKVQPILASTSVNGTTVVWDLRKQKPIISFSDSDRRRCSVLQWHPDFATQLIVASDDDSSPSLRIWDMRNTMSPLRELVGHTKGVVAMSWCPNDSTYLLTCAKDNRTICWDTNSAEIVSELPSGTNWNFDVHWYPKIPGVISASSFDGKIGIYNIEACARYGVGESYLVSETCHQPWKNGLVLFEDRERNKHCLSTGCKSFDVLLQGGLREGQVTELVGPSSSGKTQICFQVASNVAMKLGSAVFLDSGNSFSPTRIKQIVTRISGSLENQAGCKVRLIVIDSISSLIAPILGNNNAQGYALMVSVGYLLKKLADRHNIALVVINHMVSGEGSDLKPALGESWKNVPHVRLQFSRDLATNIYGVSILKHPYMATGRSANFMIH